MIQGGSKIGGAASAAMESVQTVNSPIVTNSRAGGANPVELDAKESATAPKFGEIFNDIQAKYGQKAEKAREIKKTLGKDDFLKIMITQMKNQDPTNPFKAEQMATEMAQMTSVEQLQNVNQNLTKLSNQNKPLEHMAMTNLIGKVVTVDRGRFPHVDGKNEELSFNLPREAKHVEVSIISETGEEVLTTELGPKKIGGNIFNWDGKRTNSLSAKTGNYIYRVSAKDDQGADIPIDSQARARVVGVSFEGPEPVFLVGNAQHQDKITMKNIVRIEVEPVQGQAQSQVQGQAQGQVQGQVQAPVQVDSPLQTVAKAPPKVFGFQKDIGSVPLGAGGAISSEAKQAIENFQKGFPNGLKEGGESQ